jgi:hypothetical protein
LSDHARRSGGHRGLRRLLRGGALAEVALEELGEPRGRAREVGQVVERGGGRGERGVEGGEEVAAVGLVCRSRVSTPPPRLKVMRCVGLATLLLVSRTAAQQVDFGCADDEYIIESELGSDGSEDLETLWERQHRCDDDPDHILATAPFRSGFARMTCWRLLRYAHEDCNAVADHLIQWRDLNGTTVASLCPETCGKCLCHSCWLDALAGRCKRGQYCQRPRGGCTNCTRGTYDSNGNPLVECEACPAGKTSEEGATSLEGCVDQPILETMEKTWPKLLQETFAAEPLKVVGVITGTITAVFSILGVMMQYHQRCCRCQRAHNTTADDEEEDPPDRSSNKGRGTPPLDQTDKDSLPPPPPATNITNITHHHHLTCHCSSGSRAWVVEDAPHWAQQLPCRQRYGAQFNVPGQRQ